VSSARPQRARLTGLLASVALAAGGLVAGCGDDDDRDAATVAAIEHVHGLGINPADGALMIASHDGLFRLPGGETAAERVGDSTQDTMGFTVTGPDRFFGSGHPGPGEDGPPLLGLIESSDGGESWRDVSLSGQADFHILRYLGDRLYGVDATSGRLMVSDDRGRSWERRETPRGLIDLAVDPRDRERIVGSTGTGLVSSEDGGRTWREAGPGVGLLAWPEPGTRILIDARGRVQASEEPGDSWRPLGTIGGRPAAFAAEDARTLYAARADGAVLGSTDGGATWDELIR
jgi:hypothetical protein